MTGILQLATLPSISGKSIDLQFIAVSDRLEAWITLRRSLPILLDPSDPQPVLDLICAWHNSLSQCEQVVNDVFDELIQVSRTTWASSDDKIHASCAHEMVTKVCREIVQTAWITACKAQFTDDPGKLVQHCITAPPDLRPLLQLHWKLIASGLLSLPKVNWESLETGLRRERAVVLQKISPQWSRPRTVKQWTDVLKISPSSFERRRDDGTFPSKKTSARGGISIDLRFLPEFDDNR